MLVIETSVNKKHKISTVGATRVSPKGSVDDDAICVYEFGRVYRGKIKRVIGTLEHRYGDGAEVLAAKVMLEVSNSEISAVHEQNYERLLDVVEGLDTNHIERKMSNGKKDT